jgi:tRNA 2-thiouridine synthesizing protein C
MKTFLFVLRRSPHEGSGIRESLDMLMTAAAFDQAVRLLFLDDGVFALKSGQQPECLGLRPVGPLFAALELYDVEGLWVEAESLAHRGLAPANLSRPTRSIARAEVAAFIAEADLVVAC